MTVRQPSRGIVRRFGSVAVMVGAALLIGFALGMARPRRPVAPQPGPTRIVGDRQDSAGGPTDDAPRR